MDIKNPKTDRRPYIKPEIEQVQLLLDESILVDNCKTIDGGPGPTVDCRFSPGGSPCTNFGS
jgi:hypothetical protein